MHLDRAPGFPPEPEDLCHLPSQNFCRKPRPHIQPSTAAGSELVLASNICAETQRSFSTSVPWPLAWHLSSNAGLFLTAAHLRDTRSLCPVTHKHIQTTLKLSQQERQTLLLSFCSLVICWISRVSCLTSVINDNVTTAAVKNPNGCTSYRAWGEMPRLIFLEPGKQELTLSRESPRCLTCVNFWDDSVVMWTSWRAACPSREFWV